MRAARRRDTGPELALRRLLHQRGLRYRVDAPLTGTRRRADVCFTSRRIAVFVDGCFWHSCPQHGTLPKANHEWWADKLERNVTRDRDTDAVLSAASWRVVRVWEHEDMGLAADRIESLVRGTTC
jgi:DNA mismatch endonuclease (patch repair protein)